MVEEREGTTSLVNRCLQTFCLFIGAFMVPFCCPFVAISRSKNLFLK